MASQTIPITAGCYRSNALDFIRRLSLEIFLEYTNWKQKCYLRSFHFLYIANNAEQRIITSFNAHLIDRIIKFIHSLLALVFNYLFLKLNNLKFYHSVKAMLWFLIGFVWKCSFRLNELVVSKSSCMFMLGGMRTHSVHWFYANRLKKN